MPHNVQCGENNDVDVASGFTPPARNDTEIAEISIPKKYRAEMKTLRQPVR
jgi:hypothetical protein